MSLINGLGFAPVFFRATDRFGGAPACDVCALQGVSSGKFATGGDNMGFLLSGSEFCGEVFMRP